MSCVHGVVCMCLCVRCGVHVFVREGHYGRVNRGLYRVRQFSKVELVSLTMVETGRESEEALQEMLLMQREIVEDLGLHYRWEEKWVWFQYERN